MHITCAENTEPGAAVLVSHRDLSTSSPRVRSMARACFEHGRTCINTMGRSSYILAHQ